MGYIQEVENWQKLVKWITSLQTRIEVLEEINKELGEKK